jgi:uncharacterized protein (TIGR04255 family)
MKRPPARSAAKRTKFKNPPIHELTIALFHLPIVEMKSQHVGIYWDIIREKYPLCEQQPPISLVNFSDAQFQPTALFQEVPGEVFPLPRFWFSSRLHPTLIQVQRNAFIFNWRRLPGSGEYPHYETVVEDFWHELAAYKTFIKESVGGKIDVIHRCELTYVNLIIPNEMFANPAQLMNVLPLTASLYDVQTDNRQLTGLNSTVTYRVNPTLHIDLAIRLGQRFDTKELAAMLELKAHGVPSDLSLDQARDWYDSAHQATYDLFLDATDKQIQKKIWKPNNQRRCPRHARHRHVHWQHRDERPLANAPNHPTHRAI